MDLKRLRRPLSVLLVGLAAFALAWGLSRTAFFTTVEGKTWDWRVRNLAPQTPPGPSLLVLIDEPTLKKWQVIAQDTAWKDFAEKNESCAGLLKAAQKLL